MLWQSMRLPIFLLTPIVEHSLDRSPTSGSERVNKFEYIAMWAYDVRVWITWYVSKPAIFLPNHYKCEFNQDFSSSNLISPGRIARHHQLSIFAMTFQPLSDSIPSFIVFRAAIDVYINFESIGAPPLQPWHFYNFWMVLIDDSSAFPYPRVTFSSSFMKRNAQRQICCL